MAEKRKSKVLEKGRVLKDGESERPKEGRFMYRWKDIRGKYHSIYGKTLDELREKEAMIQRDLFDGIDYAAGEITVLELVERYLRQKKGVRYNTEVGYNYVVGLLKKQDFSDMKVKAVTPSQGRLFFIKLHEENGYRYSTITTVRGVLRPAFEMAVEDNIVRRNPFSFRVVDVVPNDSATRKALTPEEKERFLAYLQGDKCRHRYYDEVVILLGTGLRISELYGLTRADIDFEKRRIRVERQLTRNRLAGELQYRIEKPKTESGERYIPMVDNAVYQAFQRVVSNRRKPKTEYIIDGHTGFLFLDKDGKPKVAGHLEHALKRIVDHYNESHEDKLTVSPHVLRHTFCTDMANAGMPIKNLQYLMGHSDVGVTLNTYTHASYEMAEKAMSKIINLDKFSPAEAASN